MYLWSSFCKLMFRLFEIRYSVGMLRYKCASIFDERRHFKFLMVTFMFLIFSSFIFLMHVILNCGHIVFFVELGFNIQNAYSTICICFMGH